MGESVWIIICSDNFSSSGMVALHATSRPPRDRRAENSPLSKVNNYPLKNWENFLRSGWPRSWGWLTDWIFYDGGAHVDIKFRWAELLWVFRCQENFKCFLSSVCNPRWHVRVVECCHQRLMRSTAMRRKLCLIVSQFGRQLWRLEINPTIRLESQVITTRYEGSLWTHEHQSSWSRSTQIIAPTRFVTFY